MTWFNEMLEAAGHLAANRTYYVRSNDDPLLGPTGSDYNDGSEAAPFRTVQHASNVISKLNFGPYVVTLNLRGDFSDEYAGIAAMTSNGPSQYIIEGDISDPSVARVGGLYPSGTHCTIRGIEYVGDGFYGDNGLVAVDHVRAAGQMRSQVNAVIQVGVGVELAGNGESVLRADQHSAIMLMAPIAVIGEPTLSIGFAEASDGGTIRFHGSSQPTGTATGKRFKAVTGGVINTNGGGANYLPGTTAGDTESGGIYA